MKRTKQERLNVVLNISRQLKEFPRPDDPSKIINLWDMPCPTITTLKTIFKDYINQDNLPDYSPRLHSFAGAIPFPELHRKIEYIFPIKCHIEPLFVLRSLMF